ncbi:MAG: four helix bundle protein [Bacteroidota bacterium]|nr:four helix bundle protein [Bacteroidota bacterium]
MRLDDLNVYKESMSIGEEVWEIVNRWDYFAKDTVGKQLVKSVDSISANISEGYGRFHYKENKQFCFYSRGSLTETSTWIQKAVNRKLIEKETGAELITKLERIHKMLNGYINSIGRAPYKPQVTPLKLANNQ